MKKEIYKLMLIKATRSFLLVMPIIALYFQDNGLSMRDIFILQVIFSLAIVLFEVPTGYFADLFKRKTSIIVGSITGTLGFFLYYLAYNFWTFALAETILAMSSALISGADSAFLYDTLKEYKKENEHIKYQGRLFSLRQVSEAVASILGGSLAGITVFKNVFLLQFIVIGLSIPVAFSLKEPKKEFSNAEKQQFNIFEIIKFVMHENKYLFYLNIFAGAVSTSTLVMVWFAQPYMKELAVPIVYFGIIWAVFNIIVSAGALLASKIEKTFSFRVLFGMIAFAPFLFYLTLSFNLKWLSLSVLPFFWLLRGVTQPIFADYINKEVVSEIRATVLSVSSLIGRVFFVILSPFLGYVADTWSFSIAFLASGAILGILCIFSFILFYLQRYAKFGLQSSNC